MQTITTVERLPRNILNTFNGSGGGHESNFHYRKYLGLRDVNGLRRRLLVEKGSRQQVLGILKVDLIVIWTVLEKATYQSLTPQPNITIRVVGIYR